MTALALDGHRVTLFKPEFSLKEDFACGDSKKTRCSHNAPDLEMGMCKII